MPSQIESRTHDPVAATASASAQALLSMRGITKSYGDHVVLNHIDLDVASREKVAVIGPSGSGKTTILRAAIGLVKPDEGTIRIDGEYLWHVKATDGLRPAGERHARRVRRAVGIVFQQFNLFPHHDGARECPRAARSRARDAAARHSCRGWATMDTPC